MPVVSTQSACVYVHIKDKPYTWKGVGFGSCHAGAFYIDVRNGALGDKLGGQTTRAYCIKYGDAIYIGKEYRASLTAITDDEKRKEIAYIMTW